MHAQCFFSGVPINLEDFLYSVYLISPDGINKVLQSERRAIQLDVRFLM